MNYFSFRKTIVLLAVGLLGCFVVGCGGAKKDTRKKVFYINSYHSGYTFSDEVRTGIFENLPADSFEIASFYLDGKRVTDELVMFKNVKSCLDSIEKFSPDIIIASDDNAVKDVIVPNFVDKNIPVVFCGINWSCSQYGLPAKNITGIVEVWPIRQTLQAVMQANKDIKKLLFLSENTISEQKNCNILDTLYKNLGLVVNYELVDNFAEWKEKFILGNKQFDVIYQSAIGGIKDWDEQEALKLINEKLKVPVISFEDHLMKYSVFGMTKINYEQGEWAAKTAKKILSGTEPSKIPVTSNKQMKLWINSDLAKKINFKLDSSLLKKCEEIK